MAKPVQEQLRILSEGFVDLISEEELEAKLRLSEKTKKPLRIKYGADPSAPDLHLGHTVALRKLRQFQEFGHKIVFIIGDFTAQIGDPTQRSETRKMLSPEAVKANAKTYQEQVFRILERKKTEVRYNSEWLGKMRPEEFMELMRQYTVARLLERDDFKKRYTANKPITLLEFMYPLLQGYDSVQIKADVELGGTDQKFNLLVGRDLQRAWQEPPQVVMTLPLIEGTDGVQKMSKSLDNHIAIQDSPREMFGKVMSIPDALMENYFRYASDLPAEEIRDILEGLKSGKRHPRECKAYLAETLVRLYHDEAAAEHAKKEFDEIFKNKGLPDEVPLFELAHKKLDLLSVLKEANLVASKGEGRRLIQQGGVRVNNEKVSEPAHELELSEPVLIQCGKRKFARVCHAR